MLNAYGPEEFFSVIFLFLLQIQLCRLWMMCKDLLVLFIYIIPFNIFLSCSRGVKGTLVKEKVDIPSPKSFLHRRQTAISSAEKKLSQGRKGRAMLGSCQLKSMQKGKLVYRP